MILLLYDYGKSTWSFAAFTSLRTNGSATCQECRLRFKIILIGGRYSPNHRVFLFLSRSFEDRTVGVVKRCHVSIQLLRIGRLLDEFPFRISIRTFIWFGRVYRVKLWGVIFGFRHGDARGGYRGEGG